MSNFLENIEIKNFKSIRHQKIDGCKRINVFIGYPNVGKSNILEGLSFLSYIHAGNPKISQLCRIQEFSELFFDGNIGNPISINYSNSRGISLLYESDQNFILSHNIKGNDKAMYPNRISSNRNIEVQRIELSKDKQALIEETEKGKFYIDKKKYSPINVKKYDYKKDVLKNQSGFNTLFFPDGQNLFYIIESNSELRREVAELFNFYDLKLAFEKGDKYSLRILKVLNDGTIYLLPFHQIADTLQRLIFYKAAIKTNNDTVLLFEEPEAHMFPPYVKKFTTDVIYDETNQFFIATHSPYVLDAFMEDATNDLAVFLVDYKNGETIINKLSDNTLLEIRNQGVDLFFNLESYMNNG